MRHFTIILVVLNFSNCGFLLYSYPFEKYFILATFWLIKKLYVPVAY
jgi:hypothetical protein